MSLIPWGWIWVLLNRSRGYRFASWLAGRGSGSLVGMSFAWHTRRLAFGLSLGVFTDKSCLGRGGVATHTGLRHAGIE